MQEAFEFGAAVDAYLSTVDGAIRERSDAYDEGEQLWGLFGSLISIVIVLGLYAAGFFKALRDRLEGWMPRWLAVFPFLFVYSLVTSVLVFPLTYYVDHAREHAFGLSTQTFGAWFGEFMIENAIGLVIGTILTGFLVYLIRALKRTWWIWGAVGGAAAVAVLIAASPVFIEPLFNEYTPMEEGPLKTDILLMAEAAGVPADNVLVYDRSSQTNTISANVAGLFGTTRIALADTLLNDATPEEVRAVMAHEIGHYVLGHVGAIILVLALLIAGAFVFAQVTFRGVQAALGETWGIRDIGDVAGIPLLFTLIGVFFTLATPITNTLIRTNETQADVFGLALAREPDGFAAVSMKLSAYRKLDPGPVERFIFHDHPTGRDRVEMAMRFKEAQLAAGAQDIDPSNAPLTDEVRRYLAEREAGSN